MHAEVAPAQTPATPATQFSAKAERMKFRVQKTTELPPMPEMAQKIFSLNSNPYARIQDLAQVVEVDPSFAALGWNPEREWSHEVAEQVLYLISTESAACACKLHEFLQSEASFPAQSFESLQS